MKVLTDRHPVEQALQQIEQILCEKGLSISYCYGIIITDKNGKEYRVVNVAGSSSGDSLPRFCEEDKLTPIN